MAFNPNERVQYVISSVEMPLCAFWLTVAQGGMWLTKLHTA
jgi:hypothetical protein